MNGRHPVTGISADEAVRRLPPRAGRGRDWYRIEGADADEADVYIYDVIGWPFVTADEFVAELNAVEASRMRLHVNSPGGDVWEAIAIYNALLDHPAEVEARVDGIAASAASVVTMAGDRVVMNRRTTMMIHDPWMLMLGDAAELRKMADLLDRIGDQIAEIYAARAGGSVREWRDAMLEETWYTDREAVDAGLADEVAGEPAAQNRFDLSIFANTPDHLRRPARDGARQPTIRDAERALRDAGLSTTAAKAVLARGWSEREGADARDVRVLEELAGTLRLLTGRSG